MHPKTCTVCRKQQTQVHDHRVHGQTYKEFHHWPPYYFLSFQILGALGLMMGAVPQPVHLMQADTQLSHTSHREDQGVLHVHIWHKPLLDS